MTKTRSSAASRRRATGTAVFLTTVLAGIPSTYLDDDRPTSVYAESGADVQRDYAAGRHLSLSELEALLRNQVRSYAPASEYRARCAASGQHDRAIDFFKELVRLDPGDNRARIELASAYVDKIPTCGGLMAALCRGSLAGKSLDLLDEAIEREQDSWVAYYCRAMNHLHWPRALRHADDAVDDFQRCIALQERDPEHAGKSHHALAYVGLGDARAKAKQFDEARSVWRTGLEKYPDSTALARRLAIKDNRAVRDFVDRERGLDRPVDTSLGFLDK